MPGYADLEDLNRQTLVYLERVRAGEEVFDIERVKYFGYVSVDMFDCPPFSMFTNNDSPVVNYILRDQTFEPQSLSLWCALCRTATGIVDVGANVGIYSLAAAGIRPDLKIHAFEPNPYAYARLRMHKSVNELDNIEEHTVALGHADCVTKFRWAIKPGGNISSGGSVGKVRYENLEESSVVRMVKFDNTGIVETLGNQPLIKIDVEGSEVQTLSGMNQVLRWRPDMIMETFSQDACDALNPTFHQLGYSFYLIDETNRTFDKRDRLLPCVADANHNYNQFLTIRPLPEL